MTPSLEADRAEAALEAVLAEPPFVGSGLGSEGVWRRIWDILTAWYQGVLSDVYEESPATFWLLMIGLLVVLAVLIWHLSISVRDVWRSIRRAGELREEGEVEVEALTLAPAQAALAAGDFRLAVELAWSTAVRGLVARFGPARGETPRQQARSLVAALPAGRGEALEGLVRAHEHACYSGADTEAELARQALSDAEALLAPEDRRGG